MPQMMNLFEYNSDSTSIDNEEDNVYFNCLMLKDVDDKIRKDIMFKKIFINLNKGSMIFQLRDGSKYERQFQLDIKKV